MNEFHLTRTDHIDQGRSYAIQQGASFDWLTFHYPDDVSSWNPRGQIRTDYRSRGGNLVADFDFDPLVYVSQTINGTTAFRTKIKPKLSAITTASMSFNLKRRKTSEDVAVPGRNVWVYDIELERPLDGLVVKISRGFVEVELEATGGVQ